MSWVFLPQHNGSAALMHCPKLVLGGGGFGCPTLWWAEPPASAGGGRAPYSPGTGAGEGKKPASRRLRCRGCPLAAHLLPGLVLQPRGVGQEGGGREVLCRDCCAHSRSRLGDFSYAVATCWPEMSLYRDKRLFGSPWFGHRGHCCLRGSRAIPELALLRGLRRLLQRVLAFPIAHVINAAGCCLLSGLGTCLGWLGL